MVSIIPYQKKHANAFKTLNAEWLEKYFWLEPEDNYLLNNPEEAIINKGGHIIMAEYNGELVGCCALKHEGHGRYELAKMAVTQKYQGLGIGKQIGLAVIEKAKALQAKTLYLVTSTKLKPAQQLYEKLGFVEVAVTEEDKARYQRCDFKMRYTGQL